MSTTTQSVPPVTQQTFDQPMWKLYLLVCLTGAILVSVEGMAIMIHNYRAVTLVIEGGIDEALAIRHTNTQRQILFAGNSLIFDDVSSPVLQQTMGPKYRVYVSGVPGSTYYDWQYGLRALFRRGSQPDVLVFAVSPSQILRPAAVTPLLISKLWTMTEIIEYLREQHPGLTTTSELVLEHSSTFFYLRDIVRIYVRKFIPGYEAMVNGWTTSGSSLNQISGSGAQAAFYGRLSALKHECPPGTRFILLISPTNQFSDQALETALRDAAMRAGIVMIEPVGEREWPRSKFQPDGYHLTAESAMQFSRLVGAALAQVEK